MTTVSRTMTVEEFAEYAAGHGRCELIRGEVHDLSPTGMQHGDVTGRFHILLGAYVLQHRLGKVFAAETGFRLDDDGTPTVRTPDISFISTPRIVVATESFCPIPPDLVVETLSPTDKASEVAEKVQWWLDRGVRLVWIVDPQIKVIDVRSKNEIHRLRMGESLTGGEVIPGFVCPLAEVFA